MSTYIYLRDAGGQTWQVGATAAGNLQLTAVSGDPGSINTTGTSRPGLTRADIIERVHMRTRRLAEGVLDMDSILSDCLQEICSEQRWPWRRKWVTFTTTAGTSTYDLGGASILAGDMEEIIRVVRIDSANERSTLRIISDPDKMVAAQEDTTQDDPSAFFLDPGSEQTLHLTPVPKSTKTIRVIYWAIPNLNEAAFDIPLLPARYYRALVKRMEAEVWALTPGEGVESPNYMKSVAEYQHILTQMQMKQNFSVQEARNFVMSENAVAST